jgi:hypothetical protein
LPIQNSNCVIIIIIIIIMLCVLGTASVVYWSDFLTTDPEVRVRFPALSDFLRSSGFGTGPLRLVSTIEELLGRNNSGSGLENREYGRGDPLH